MRWTKLLLVIFTVCLPYRAFGASSNCERLILLDVDLSGHYVLNNLNTKQLSLVQLRRLGDTPAYTVSEFKLVEQGAGLGFQRQTTGWNIGDEFHPERKVNVMNLQRDGDNVAFRFEDTTDVNGFYYLAKPDGEGAIGGDILSPSHLNMRFEHGIQYPFLMTRIQIDNVFNKALSEPMKLRLANRLNEPESARDSVIVVEFKRSMTSADAAEVLDASGVVPLEESSSSGSNQGQAMRFAVPFTLPQFLQVWPTWARRWEVARVDTVPLRQLHADLLQQVERIIDAPATLSALEDRARTTQAQREQVPRPRRDARLPAPDMTPAAPSKPNAPAPPSPDAATPPPQRPR